MEKRLFYLDDDPLILESFEMIFTDLGYHVETCSDSTRAVEILRNNDFDLIISDIRMPGMNGAQAVRAIKEAKPSARIMVLTAFPGDPVVQAAMEAGAEGVMKKPFDIAKIMDLMGS